MADQHLDVGAFIREQRRLAELSVRRLAEMSGVSNPYLSQIERGLRRPSAEILANIARGLQISAETLYVQAGILDGDPDTATASTRVEEAIRTASELTPDQRKALLGVYRSFVPSSTAGTDTAGADTAEAGAVAADTAATDAAVDGADGEPAVAKGG